MSCIVNDISNSFKILLFKSPLCETNILFYGASCNTVLVSTAVPLKTSLYYIKLTKLSSTLANDTKQSDLRQRLTAPRAWDQCTNWNLLRNADIFHDWHHTSEKVEKGLKVLNTLRKVPWLSISSSSIAEQMFHNTDISLFHLSLKGIPCFHQPCDQN